MATCVPFQTQLSSIMEVLVKAAVAEISKLFDDKCAFLQLEINRKQGEIEMLRRKLSTAENRNAQLQRGFENYMDRGTDVGTNCPPPTGNIKVKLHQNQRIPVFSGSSGPNHYTTSESNDLKDAAYAMWKQKIFKNKSGLDINTRTESDLSASLRKMSKIEDAAVSFTIKEESPDEPLWISETTGPIGGSVSYPNPANPAESQQLEEDCQLAHPEVVRLKTSEFGDLYDSGQHTGDASGLHFTIKTEKEETRSGFGQDGCQHSAGKPAQLAAEFCMEERENQLWSSIIEGNDIDTGFPDFSSMVEEYSATFPEHTDNNVASSANKSTGVPQSSSQRTCNGLYNSDFQKDAPQSSGFQSRPQGDLSQQDRPKEQMYPQRNMSHVALLRQPDEHPERDNAAGDRPLVTHSHSTFTAGGFHAHTPHKAFSGTARGYVCLQCGKTFGRLHQFKLHQQSHKRKRAFWCTVCGKSFQCSSHLSIHHRTHTGEKPYGCGQCGKRFTQQSSLRVHQRTHSGERPYSCAQCGKTFILMHHLKRHRIIHTYS